MDSILENLVSIVSEMQYENFSEEIVHIAKRIVVDSFGCAYGSWSEGPPLAVRALASKLANPIGATIIGSGVKTSPDLAAFVNGTMIRYLDYNDSGQGGGHPSDYLSAILAAAEFAERDGRSVVAGIVASYEIFEQLSHFTRVDLLDHVTYGAVAAASGASAAMGLSRYETAQALSLAVVSNVALRTTRLGGISEWKGCAGGNAARNGLHSAMLASIGVSGPGHPYEGSGGFCQLLNLDPADCYLTMPSNTYAVQTLNVKRYPIGLHSQSAVDAVLTIRARHPKETIESVHIDTYASAKRVMADEEKWHPKTRETADHSIPYVVATALLHGDVKVEYFDLSHITSPAVVGLMQAITVEVEDDCEARFPKELVAKVSVRFEGGIEDREEVGYFRGHSLNPVSDADLVQKFHNQASHVLNEQEEGLLLNKIWMLDELQTITELMKSTVGIRSSY